MPIYYLKPFFLFIISYSLHCVFFKDSTAYFQDLKKKVKEAHRGARQKSARLIPPWCLPVPQQFSNIISAAKHSRGQSQACEPPTFAGLVCRMFGPRQQTLNWVNALILLPCLHTGARTVDQLRSQIEREPHAAVTQGKACDWWDSE